MTACFCQNPVVGVGQFEDVASDVAGDVATDAASSGVWSSIGDFFSNGFGSDLLKAGVTVGTGYAVSQLGGGSKPGAPAQVQYTNPLTGQSNVPSTGTAGPAASSASTPTWVLPVSILGGAVVLGLLLMKRR